MTAPPATVTPRHRLADELEAALVGTGVQVYAAPPDVIAVPALVVAPGSPYRVDHTYAGEAWAFDLLALVTRPTDPRAAFDALDELIRVARVVVLSLKGATWGEVTSVGETLPIGGITYLSAACKVTLLAQEG